MNTCELIQNHIADAGVDALSPEDRAHLESCAECAAFAAALSELDSAFAALPKHDAPEGLVERTVREAKKRKQASRRFPVWQTMHLPSRRALAVALTLALALVFSLKGAVTRSQQARFFNSEFDSEFNSESNQIAPERPLPGAYSVPGASSHEPNVGDGSRLKRELGSISELKATAESRKGIADKAQANQAAEAQADIPAEEQYSDLITAFKSEMDAAKSDSMEARENIRALQKDLDENKERTAEIFEKLIDRVDTLSSDIGSLSESTRPSSPTAAGRQNEDRRRDEADPVAKNKKQVRVDLLAGVNAPTDGTDYPAVYDQKISAKPSELKFQDPSGYWANTYLPGNPRERQLEAALRAGRLPKLEHRLGREQILHALANTPVQPFDIPARSALGLQVTANKRHVEGETRMLVQVGIKGAERTAGRRAALNLGIVLHLEHPDSKETQARVRALLEELSKSVEIGERFGLFVSGEQLENRVQPNDFKWGPIQLALEKAFASPGSSGALSRSYAGAVESVTGLDTASAPLGTSAVLVITDAAAVPHEVEHLAAKGTAGAITTSVISVGAGSEGLDALALSGHGRRTNLSSPADAKRIVDQELAASSRAVARAIRLRIKLHPGVKLVDIPGSFRLNPAAAQVERAAELTIDRRIAASLGIEADRGKDEDGIQILIPAFYSGDDHVILLDVVVPGPGPVVDVQARFKDLVALSNNTLTATFSAERGSEEPHAFEWNVQKNLRSLQLASALGDAARALRAGNWNAAAQAVESQHALLASLPAELARDRDLQSDLAMVTDYRSALQLVADDRGVDRRYVADSLEYAGLKKRL